MSLAYTECLRKGKIKEFSRGKSLAPKELDTAASDLNRAYKTFDDGDYKWATIQMYYAMFHAGRAMIYSRNLREHSHFCLIEAISNSSIKPKISSPKLYQANKTFRGSRPNPGMV
jgi:uncharacterized protein (UPF0332 family)